MVSHRQEHSCKNNQYIMFQVVKAAVKLLKEYFLLQIKKFVNLELVAAYCTKIYIHMYTCNRNIVPFRGNSCDGCKCQRLKEKCDEPVYVVLTLKAVYICDRLRSTKRH